MGTCLFLRTEIVKRSPKDGIPIMNIYAIGTRIRLIHTGDEGVIAALLPDNMATILLEDGDKIPVFLDDIESIEDEKRALSAKPPIKAKVVKGKTPQIPKSPDWPDPHQQYTILKSQGIQLCFEAYLRADGIPDHYSIFLVNDTKSDILFTCQVSKRNLKGHKSHGKLNQMSAQEVGKLSYDDLNEGSVVTIEAWQVTTAGNGSRMEKEIKLKPKQFFNNKKTAPILNRMVHHYVVFANFNITKKEAPGEDLQTYTRRQQDLQESWQPLQQFYQSEVNDFANFPNDIDLHIEHLTHQIKGLSNSEIVAIQVDAFDKYLARAIELGVSPVFIIHGLGKGKLRKVIAQKLRGNPAVISFKNEYHHKYGWGATEVRL